MEEKPDSASCLDMLERMRSYLGLAGQMRRSLEERLRSLLEAPMAGDEPCAEGED
jgi:hypothetical protein